MTPFTYVTLQFVVGAGGAYLISRISSARAGAVHSRASPRRPRWGVCLCVQVLPNRSTPHPGGLSELLGFDIGGY